MRDLLKEIVIKRCESAKEVEDIRNIEDKVFSVYDRYSAELISFLCRHCGSTTYIAYHDGKPVAYASSCIEGLEVGHLISIAVLEEYRRRGVGTLIMCKSLLELSRRNVKLVVLEVRKSNAVAIRFYERFGFKRLYTIHQYYPDGEDAYVMALGRDDLARALSSMCREVLSEGRATGSC